MSDEKDPKTDQIIQRLQAQIEHQKSRIDRLESLINGITIVGAGFSGFGPNGISFDQNMLTVTRGGAGPKGDKGDQGDPGTAATITVTAECVDGEIQITASTDP